MKRRQKANAIYRIGRLCNGVGTLLLIVWLTVAAQAAPGDLDSTFGNGGAVTTSMSNLNDFSRILRPSPTTKS